MKRAGDIFSALFDHSMMMKADGYSALVSCWTDLMEKNGIAAAAAHSWIKSMDRGLVWIEVDHPGWKQILQTKEGKLVSDFRRRFPDMDISGIVISLARPGSQPQPPAATVQAESAVQEASPPPYQPTTAPVTDGEGYDAIQDDALKAVLMRLEQHIAARESAKK
jgi:hypothetical protein